MDKLYNAIASNDNSVWDFYRGDIEEYAISGYPIMFNADVVVINYIYDFILDGYKVIRTKDITEYDYASDRCKFINSLYMQENIVPQKPKWIEQFETFEELICQLSKNEIICSVECELSDEMFYIGKICDVNENCIKMICFDPLCKLYDEHVSICMDDITTISFENRYATVMGKYVKWNK